MLKMRKMSKTGLLCLLLPQACASTGVRPLHPYEIATAAYHRGGSETVVGSLMYEGSCLLFQSDDGSSVLLPVWPTGSVFEESLVTFHQPAKAAQRVIIGEEIALDGQRGDWAGLSARRYAPFEKQCAAIPFFVSGVAPAN